MRVTRGESTRRGLLAGAVGAALIATAGLPGQAQAEGELNIYSSRHYDTDERLYSDFEEQTGITINRIEDSADVLLERINSEGANSPADLLITVDAGRLWKAEEMGLLAPVENDLLNERIPSHLRDDEGHWFGFSKRVRVIFYDKNDVEAPPQTYEALADPQYEGMVCTRTSSNIYMLSLMAALIDHKGEEAAEEWAAGVWANRARDPEGGDTDQIRAIVSGECEIAVANTYYFARALRKDVDGLSGSTDMVGWVFPNQQTTGSHANISGAGVVATAPNQENAIKFLEYLASDQAQQYFAEGNDEYPAVVGVELPDSLKEMGDYEEDGISLTVYGANQALAQQIYDRVGYE
ncbi:extracellular solute-binding protein [Algihabitans albus]|uniref:extracellular solute-binding protein n=1 Tax=Algihabitans albus TaxID=2164067 RepID=UPI000E5C5FE9|nr:extracellular solute-binding protein [Algihabitans albus]